LLRNALPGNALRENPSNPSRRRRANIIKRSYGATGGDFTSFQRLGPLANRTTIGCTTQTTEIS
jgi:hypothetical protein